MNKNIRVVITGAAGLLGEQAVRFFCKNYAVHAILRRKDSNEVPGVKYHYLDLSSDFDLSKLPRQVDVIIHLAQSSKFREFPEEALDVFNVNVGSLARLLDYARSVGCKKFIYASSGGVYESGASVVYENSPIVPHGRLGYYLGSKLCGEVLAQNYSNIMDVSVLRFFFIYGRRQRRSMLLPRLVDNIAAGRPIQLQSENGLVINPIHVQDAVSALDYVVRSDGSNTFNIAGVEEVSLKELSQSIGQLLGKDPVFDIKDGESSRLVANVSALQGLGWSPSIFLADGLKDLMP